MFLEMHRPFSAGLNDFASHLWYVIPMAVAITVLSRLRPQVRLSGMPVYDEVAVEFRPDEAGEYDSQCQLGMLRGKPNVE